MAREADKHGAKPKPDDAAIPLGIRLLGGFDWRSGDRALPLPRFRKSQVVLALLVLRHSSPGSTERGEGGVEREVLAGLLWPDAAQAAALHNLRNSLTDLRQALGPQAGRLRSPTFRTVALDLTGAFVDLLAFDAALARGNPESLEEAVSLYGGPLLEGQVPGGAGWEAWVFHERQGREQGYLAAREKLAARALALGNPAEAEQHLRAVVTTDPLRESAQRALMELLATEGNFAAALLVYRELRDRLLRELNAEPDPETRTLFERLRAAARGEEGNGRLVAPSNAGTRAARSSAARETAARPRDSLPRRMTRFFGRDAEIEQIGAMLGDPETALVTLTGPGGCGKTSLALETARRLHAAGTAAAGRHSPRAAAPSEEVPGVGWDAGLPLHAARHPGPAHSSASIDADSGRQQAPGCWFVPLLDLADPALILDKVRDALLLPRHASIEPLEQIAAALLDTPMLLVMDNFEQLIEGGPEVVQALLERVASLTVLITSRRRLGLPGEREFPLAPLPVPGIQVFRAARIEQEQEQEQEQEHEHEHDLNTRTPDYLDTLLRCPSVAVFVDRARAVRPDFQVTPANAAAVAALCRRLEGLPLAIVLAAARSGVLTPEQMLERLGRRFELLAGPDQPANPRHRSLRAALDWSFQLLPAEVQRFFARLSVFRGGWSLEAAEAVCGEDGIRCSAFGVRDDPGPRRIPKTEHRTPTLPYLEELQRCSLVVAEPADEEMRYRLLETVREYGAEQLTPEERAALARRHREYYCARMQQGLPGIGGRTIRQKLDEIEREQDNLRAAVDEWVLSGASLDCLMQPEEPHWGLLRVLPWYWSVRGSAAEGRQRLAQILALPRAAAPTLARAYLLAAAGRLAHQQREFAAAEVLLQESRAIYQARAAHSGEQWCCQTLAHVARDRGDYARARSFHQQHLALARETRCEREIGCALAGMGHIAYLESDMERARELLNESLCMLRKGHELAWARARQEAGAEDRDAYRAASGHLDELAWACAYRGAVAHACGEYAAARIDLEESLALWVELGHLRPAASARQKLGWVADREGWRDAAEAHFREALAFWQEDGDPGGMAECLAGLAAVAGSRNELENAARLLGAADALRESHGVPLPAVERADHERAAADVRDALGETVFAAAWAAGRARHHDQVVAEALQEALAD